MTKTWNPLPPSPASMSFPQVVASPPVRGQEMITRTHLSWFSRNRDGLECLSLSKWLAESTRLGIVRHLGWIINDRVTPPVPRREQSQFARRETNRYKENGDDHPFDLKSVAFNVLERIGKIETQPREKTDKGRRNQVSALIIRSHNRSFAALTAGVAITERTMKRAAPGRRPVVIHHATATAATTRRDWIENAGEPDRAGRPPQVRPTATTAFQRIGIVVSAIRAALHCLSHQIIQRSDLTRKNSDDTAGLIAFVNCSAPLTVLCAPKSRQVTRFVELSRT